MPRGRRGGYTPSIPAWRISPNYAVVSFHPCSGHTQFLYLDPQTKRCQRARDSDAVTEEARDSMAARLHARPPAAN